jgi:hypothetical protein
MPTITETLKVCDYCQGIVPIANPHYEATIKIVQDGAVTFNASFVFCCTAHAQAAVGNPATNIPTPDPAYPTYSP